MSSVFEVLEKVRTKPGLYIGRPSVSDLFMFLVGYEYARSELGNALSAEDDDFYGEFQPWLQNKLGVKTVTSWAKIIMLYCQDEKAGFEYFFKLLDEFKQRNIDKDKYQIKEKEKEGLETVVHG
ncbi:hypothetical protein [Sphaerospermopsis torques-reginae]|uniref:hypothetical protein n=1 Tax=Sphaerospermopsis torques-reginae TaxID=984207 RepID=UPI001FE3CAEF|nr:hypothetical protein [Sphaerospermopsis torques-reginae]